MSERRKEAEAEDDGNGGEENGKLRRICGCV